MRDPTGGRLCRAGGGFPTRPHLAKAGGEDAKGSQSGRFQVGRLPWPDMEKSNEINAPQFVRQGGERWGRWGNRYFRPHTLVRALTIIIFPTTLRRIAQQRSGEYY